MKRGLGLFFARLLTGKHKDSFAAQLGATLLLAELGIVGRWAKPLNFIIRAFLGMFMESAIFFIDLSLDAYREGQKLDEFNKLSTEAYEKATAKVYTEKEKDEIRKEYLAIVSKIGNVGNPVV